MKLSLKENIEKNGNLFNFRNEGSVVIFDSIQDGRLKRRESPSFYDSGLEDTNIFDTTILKVGTSQFIFMDNVEKDSLCSSKFANDNKALFKMFQEVFFGTIRMSDPMFKYFYSCGEFYLMCYSGTGPKYDSETVFICKAEDFPILSINQPKKYGVIIPNILLFFKDKDEFKTLTKIINEDKEYIAEKLITTINSTVSVFDYQSYEKLNQVRHSSSLLLEFSNLISINKLHIKGADDFE